MTENAGGLLVVPLELGCFQLFQDALGGGVFELFREFCVFSLELFILVDCLCKRALVLLELGLHSFDARDVLVQQFGDLCCTGLGIERIDAGEKLG